MNNKHEVLKSIMNNETLHHRKKALIVVNLIGFINFLINDYKILTEMGFEIEVAGNGLLKDGTEQVEVPILARKGIPFHQIDLDSKNPFSYDNLRAYRQIKKVIRNGGFELIACHTPIAGLLTRIASQRERRNSNTKVIYTTHGFSFCRRSSRKTWLIFYPVELALSSISDAIVTINSEDYAIAKRMFCNKVYKLPGVGVDLERMQIGTGFSRNAYRHSIGVKDDEVMVLSVGELSPRKNHRAIIEAVGLLSDKNRYHCIVCGRSLSGEPIEETLSKRAQELGVQVSFLGFRYDIPEINACADIAVLPSVREGLGLSGIEALAAGVPVVGSDVQGIRDYVIPGKTGFLCNPNSPQDFANSIEKIAHLDDESRVTMRMNCLKMAERFSMERSRSVLQGIFQNVLFGE